LATTRDVIYIDAEEEITAIIDKVQSAKSNLVALVLPKKTSVLQSSINIKLLKRSAEQAEKSLVLITSDESLKALAATNKIYVASDLNSKPVIPSNDSVPIRDLDQPQDLKNPTIDLSQYQSAANLGVDQQLDEIASQIPIDEDEDNQPVVDSTNQLTQSDIEPISPEITSQRKVSNLQNDQIVDSLADKNLKVPSFNRFKIIIITIIVFIILLLAFVYYIFAILPKADINIKTDALNIHINTPINLDNFQSSSSATAGVLYTKQVSYSKTTSASVPTTGSVNTGQTASGQVTIGLADCHNTPITTPFTIPAGTTVSYNNLDYETSLSATIGSNTCSTVVPVTALNNGSSYNLAPDQPMNMSTVDGISGTNFTVVSDGISGGTDNIQKAVAQADINNLNSKLTISNSGAENALEIQLESDGFYPIKSTFTTSKPQITYSNQVNQPATTLTGNEKVTYTMIGVDSNELKSFLDSLIKSKITNSSQVILNSGYQNLIFSTGNSPTNLVLSTTAEIGPKLSVSQVKSLAAGHTSSYIINQLKKNPNIKNVTVTITPSWMSTVPSNKNKIVVTIQKP